MSLRRPLHVVVGALVLVAVGCGGDDDPASTTAASPETTLAPTTAATTAPDDPQTTAGEDRSGGLLGRWEIINYALPDGGGLTNVVGDDPVFVEFKADGSVDYSTGCNTGVTEFETSGTY